LLIKTNGKKQKENVMIVESVKAAFDIYAPVSGKVTQVNSKLGAEPELVNSSPFEDGWFYEIEIADPAELENLMDNERYEGFKAH